MLDLKCPYKIKSLYKLPSFYHPTLVPAHTIEIIYVPDYAVEYTINYFMKRDILAVLYKDFKTFSKYGIYPRYLIKKSKITEHKCINCQHLNYGQLCSDTNSALSKELIYKTNKCKRFKEKYKCIDLL